MTQQEFIKWFAALDLGTLEDVRQHVEAYSIDNAHDSTGIDWDCAKYTVINYVEDSYAAKVFDEFRP